jgi:hypothetical protein
MPTTRCFNSDNLISFLNATGFIFTNLQGCTHIHVHMAANKPYTTIPLSAFLQCRWLTGHSHRVRLVLYCYCTWTRNWWSGTYLDSCSNSLDFKEDLSIEVISFLCQHTWLFPTARHLRPARAVAVGPHALPGPSRRIWNTTCHHASPAYWCTRSSWFELRRRLSRVLGWQEQRFHQNRKMKSTYNLRARQEFYHDGCVHTVHKTDVRRYGWTWLPNRSVLLLCLLFWPRSSRHDQFFLKPFWQPIILDHRYACYVSRYLEAMFDSKAVLKGCHQ